MDKLTLYIVRGAQGSGKSTLAEKLIKEGKAITHYEADMYFMKDGKYKWNPRLTGAAHQWCYLKVKESLESGKSCVVSNTFTKASEVRPYIELATDLGAEYVIYHCTGEYQNLHGVPIEKVIEKRKAHQPIVGEIDV